MLLYIRHCITAEKLFIYVRRFFFIFYWKCLMLNFTKFDTHIPVLVCVQRSRAELRVGQHFH